jgi:hypothetical protein
MEDRRIGVRKKGSSESHGQPRSALRFAAVAAVSICALFAATAAQASTVTVGSVLPVTFTAKPFEGVKTLFNAALPEKGANLVSPVSGAVVRWRVQGAKGGPFRLRVLRPNGSGAYMAVGSSGPATPTDPGIQTFTANIPIKAGDLIGVDPTNPSDEIGVAEVPGASFGFISPPPFEGSTLAPSGGESGQEIELSAEVQPTPPITSIDPATGSIAGGTAVTIAGTDFAAASAVKFGSMPATSFTVNSETEITAVAPPSTKPGAVDVTVTTLAGTSTITRFDRFAYRACVVPNLKKNKLKAAKTRLRNAGCKLGKAKKLGGATAKSGEVTKQSPKPGKVRVPGAKVNVTLE